MKSVSVFLSVIEDHTLAGQFKTVVPFMIKIAIEAVQQDPDSGCRVLESIGDIIEAHSELILPCLDDLINVLIQIIETAPLGEAIRKAGMNNLVQLTVTLGKHCRSNPRIKLAAINLLLVLEEVHQEDQEEWLQDLKHTSQES